MNIDKIRVTRFSKAFIFGVQLLVFKCLFSFSLVVTAATPVPATESGQIGLLVAKILSQEHYKRQPLNDSLSGQFLQIYLDALDYNHRIFLQSDIQEFQKFAPALDQDLLEANVNRGFEIFARYVKRMEESVALTKELLKEKFSFDGNDAIVLDRHESPWPATQEEWRQLWRQNIKYELLQERLNKKKDAEVKPAEIIEKISKRYDRLLRAVHEEDSETVLQLYLSSLAHAFDPHSDYLPPTELNNFAISMKLSLVGIGALLSSEDGYPKIIAIVPGGPADLDKRLKVNDRIAAVGQGTGPLVDVVDMKLSKAVELIRGEKNTEVHLSVIPGDASDPAVRQDIVLKRKEINLTEAEAKAKLIERKDSHGKLQRLGYIELPSFYSDTQMGPDSKSTTRDVARLIEKLKTQKIDGMILDLRKNGGGSLPEVLSLTGLFIKTGPVVQVKNSRGAVKVLSDEDSSVLYTGPLVVLVTHISASASEIFAAALQDYGRAVIVGDSSTFGKGTVQKVEELGRYLLPHNGVQPAGGALKITTQKFYRISGGSTQYRGVIPDLQWPSRLDYLKINEASLKNALSYDEVPPTFYPSEASLKNSLPYDEAFLSSDSLSKKLVACIPELRKRSQNRILHDPEFGYIQDDIARLKTQLEDKTFSLNEQKRLGEKKAELERIEKRKQERLARKQTASVTTTEITLQSLQGVSSNTPALTQKVLDAAAASLNKDSPEEAPSNDSSTAEFNESLNILSDMIELMP